MVVVVVVVVGGSCGSGVLAEVGASHWLDW